MVDATDLKSVLLTQVRVRVSPRAPIKTSSYCTSLTCRRVSVLIFCRSFIASRTQFHANSSESPMAYFRERQGKKTNPVAGNRSEEQPQAPGRHLPHKKQSGIFATQHRGYRGLITLHHSVERSSGWPPCRFWERGPNVFPRVVPDLPALESAVLIYLGIAPRMASNNRIPLLA